MDQQKHYKLIACAVLYRECYCCASISKNIIDLIILEQGLHDIGEKKMSGRLQEEIDNAEPEKYDAILLGYGLCNLGIKGLNSRIPLVIPRAHDCITLLMGSKERYLEYFNENPGTFYQSVGWMERAKDHLSNPESTTTLMGMKTYQEYVEKYGEENAKYIMDTLGGGLKNYSKLSYIDTNVVSFISLKDEQKKIASDEGWEYEELKGSTDLLLSIMNGEWEESNFLVVKPGCSVEPSYDLSIVKSI